jgi:membrane fusion protein, copper/silver efflux system
MRTETSSFSLQNKNWRKWAVYAGILILGLIGGRLIWGGGDPHAGHDHATTEDGEIIWTCSMHPQIREDGPGKCPLCGMDLTPLSASGGSGADAGIIRLSANELNLAGVRTTRVGGASSDGTIMLTGRITPDERLRAVLTAHIGGRIENLMVDFTGSRVYAGQILAEIYSPELLNAQQELRQMYQFREQQPSLYKATRDKIALWKFTESEIDAMATSAEIKAVVPVRAERSGVVTALNARKGMYVERGEMLMEIDDLSSVWVILDAFEQDLSRVRIGQTMEIVADAHPGDTFKASVRFIDPMLNPETRTVAIRAELSNPGNKLKPDMLVRARLQQGGNRSEVLTIPATAVLWTGNRSVVYVKEPGSDHDGSGFRMVDVTLGPRTGNSYEIKKGLSSGDEVVTHAAFTIDSAAQLMGMESMMSQRIQRAAEDEALQKSIVQAVKPYLDLKDALVASDNGLAATKAREVVTAWERFTTNPQNEDELEMWSTMKSSVLNGARRTASSTDLEKRRADFEILSDALIALIDRYGISGTTLYKQYCPMAFDDKGSYWISTERQIRNPYFGSMMLSCGEVRGTWE